MIEKCTERTFGSCYLCRHEGQGEGEGEREGGPDRQIDVPASFFRSILAVFFHHRLNQANVPVGAGPSSSSSSPVVSSIISIARRLVRDLLLLLVRMEG